MFILMILEKNAKEIIDKKLSIDRDREHEPIV